MVHYVALIHLDADGSYRVSFPDIPGVVTAGETIEEAEEEAAELLAFAAEDPDGAIVFNQPRTIDELNKDPAFVAASKDAIGALMNTSRRHATPTSQRRHGRASSRPATSCLRQALKAWMPGSSPGMTGQ